MKKYFYLIPILLLSVSCSDRDLVSEEPENKLENDEIKIAGVETSALEASVVSGMTRADAERKDAESIGWLVSPLKTGLDIWYWKDGSTTKDVAILKLADSDNCALNTHFDKDQTTQWAIYSFKYKSNGSGHQAGDPAIWYGNGPHHFEGMYVPDKIRYTTDVTTVNTTSAIDIITDQAKVNDDVQNYTLLERYLAMPANTTITATVGRVKLPFYHRLARVLAYVLIDPEMGSGVTLDGFSLTGTGADATDEPSSTAIRFCDVDVLKGVHDTQNSDGTHTLTPEWTGKGRKRVVPHFWKMRGSVDKNAHPISGCETNFIMYYDDNTAEYFFPTDDDWARYHAMTDAERTTAKVTKTEYGLVPVYDLIVRPTYTALNNVMYDEAGYSDPTTRNTLYNNTNQIKFELTLNNGLIYHKDFTFDLDANYHTVVYLRIGRESVDYNASGSELWIPAETYDDYYGVDNTLGHSLSKAGSSWQRAYTYGSTVDVSTGGITSPSQDKVTDGGFYNEKTDTEDGTVGQYIKADTWKQKFAQAYEGGVCHGDYFVLTHDISIDISELPVDFKFTGHLDARGHTITLTDVTEGHNALFAGLDGKYEHPEAGKANLHKEYNDILVPTEGWRAEVINLTVAGGYLFTTNENGDITATITGNVQNCKQIVSGVTKTVPNYTPQLPKFD